MGTAAPQEKAAGGSGAPAGGGRAAGAPPAAGAASAAITPFHASDGDAASPADTAFTTPPALVKHGSGVGTPRSGLSSHAHSRGLAMMDSVVDDARLRHVSSKDELEAAFRKREIAVAALKAKMSKVRCHARGTVNGISPQLAALPMQARMANAATWQRRGCARIK
jgi:hypothetical protein